MGSALAVRQERKFSGSGKCPFPHVTAPVMMAAHVEGKAAKYADPVKADGEFSIGLWMI
jgi:hypothetical protein